MKYIPAHCSRTHSESNCAENSPTAFELPKLTIAKTMTALGLGLWLVAAAQLARADTTCPVAPAADIAPERVVRTVVEALRSNQDDDQGIATVYCFASPGNKQMTGPLERFTSMIKRGYSNMLNHSDSEFEAIEVREDVALQPVWLTTASGDVIGYLFRLGKQKAGKYAGMWMTEAVYPIDPSKRSQSI